MTWIEEINPGNQIILNSGASCHIFHSTDFFVQLNHFSNGNFINTGKEGSKLLIKGKGTIQLSWKNSLVTLINFFYFPNLVINLISPGKLSLSKGYSLVSNGSQFQIYSKKSLYSLVSSKVISLF